MAPQTIWIIRSVAFLSYAIPACVYALLRGGGPERVSSVVIACAIVATTLVPSESYDVVVLPLFIIDLLVLVIMGAVAFTADRFWPLGFTAIQLLTVSTHGVRAYDPMMLPSVYARLGGELAYPAILLLVLGTWRHSLRGPEADWSWQVPHEGTVKQIAAGSTG